MEGKEGFFQSGWYSDRGKLSFLSRSTFRRNFHRIETAPRPYASRGTKELSEYTREQSLISASKYKHWENWFGESLKEIIIYYIIRFLFRILHFGFKKFNFNFYISYRNHTSKFKYLTIIILFICLYFPQYISLQLIYIYSNQFYFKIFVKSFVFVNYKIFYLLLNI